MVQYVDFFLNPLTREAWYALLCDPAYSIIKTTRIGNRQYVETSWIGMILEAEKTPGVFVVMTYKETMGLEPPSKFNRRVWGWLPNIAQAKAAHAEACRFYEKEMADG